MNLAEFKDQFLLWAQQPAVVEWLDAGHCHLLSQLGQQDFIAPDSVEITEGTTGFGPGGVAWFRLASRVSRVSDGPAFTVYTALLGSVDQATYVEMGWLNRSAEDTPLVVVKCVAPVNLNWEKLEASAGARALCKYVEKAPTLASDAVIAPLMAELYKAFSH